MQLQQENQQQSVAIGLPVKLPNFYRPSSFINPKKTDTKDPKIFPSPENGQWYTPEELKVHKNIKAVFEKVDYPLTGGLFVHLRWYKYPIRGFPVADMVEALALVKGMIPVLTTFISELMKNPLALINLKSALRAGMTKFLEYVYRGFKLRRLFPESPRLYSKMVYEIYRTLTEALELPIIDSEIRKLLKSEDKNKMLYIGREIFCFGLEFDNAYRLRIQDWLNELNYKAFMKNPRREIIRIMDLAVEREHSDGLKNKWRKIKKVINFYLKVDRKTINILKKIVSKLNFEELKFQEDDLYFIDSRDDYNFQGKIR